jgi:hypothetical protein
MRDLNKFQIKLGITGINKDTDPNAEQEFDFELGMRPHILQKKILWDKDGEQLIVQLEIENANEYLASKQMVEELFEIANAVLRRIEDVIVKTICVKISK